MPTKKRGIRRKEQLSKKDVPKKDVKPQMEVVSEKSAPMIKSDFVDVSIKQDKPKPGLTDRVSNIKVLKKLAEDKIPSREEITDYKAVSPHYISERIIGNDQLVDIAATLNKRFESGYRFKVLIPLRGNESIAIYEKIVTIEFQNPRSTVWGAGGPGSKESVSK